MLRRTLRKRRRDLSAAERRRCTAAIAEVAAPLIEDRSGKRFACYLPNDGEMDLTRRIKSLWRSGHHTFLPVLHGPRVRFLPYEPGTVLRDNHFGIPEPVEDADRRCKPSALNVVLMPLVGFDERGNRLGMGGGYYDQTFAFKQRVGRSGGPLLIGIAFEFQELDTLPFNAWEVPLDGILTESTYRHFGTG